MISIKETQSADAPYFSSKESLDDASIYIKKVIVHNLTHSKNRQEIKKLFAEMLKNKILSDIVWEIVPEQFPQYLDDLKRISIFS